MEKPEQRTEWVRQKLTRGLVIYRKKINSISAELRTLESDMELEMALAIWENVPLRSVAPAAGIALIETGLVGSLPRSGAAATWGKRSFREMTHQERRLKVKREHLGQQREKLVVTALQTGLLEPPWVAAVAGLSLERVNNLGQLKTPVQNRSGRKPRRAKPNAHRPEKAYRGGEQKQVEPPRPANHIH